MALGEASDIWRSLPEDLRPVRPRERLNTDVNILYTPSKLVIRDKKERWIAVVKRVAKKINITVWMKNEDCDDYQQVFSSDIENPIAIVGLDLDDEVKSGIAFALMQWDREVKRQELSIALSDIPVIPDRYSDKELLAYYVAKTLVEKYGVADVSVRVPSGRDYLVSYLGLRRYNGKAWVSCEEELRHWIASEVRGLQIAKISRSFDEEVKARIAMINSVQADGGRLTIAFDNCVLDLECFLEKGDLKLCSKEHSRDHYVFHHIPHNLNLEVYIPPRSRDEVLQILKIGSPRVYAFLSDAAYFDGIDPEVHRSRITFFLEMFGRGLIPGYRVCGRIVSHFKNIFVLVGRMGTGKSTILRDFFGELMLGPKNYEVVNLGKLGSDEPDEAEKALGKLAVKNPLAAMHLDLSKRTPIRDWSTIRSVSGGDPVPARRLYRDSFDYLPAWKIYISTNDPPKIAEGGAAKEALLGRFKVIEMKNKKVREKPSPQFTEEDIEATIVASLHAIRRVYLEGEYSFTGVHDIEDVLNRYTYPEYNIVMEMVEVGRLKLDPTLRISSSELYQECWAYAEEVKKRYAESGEDEEEVEKLYSLPDQAVFTKNLKMLLAKHRVKAVKEGPYVYFKGIGIPRKEGSLPISTS